MTTAQDILSKNYARIDISDTIGKLIGTLKTSKQGAALVFDDGKYVGLIGKHFLANSRIDSQTMKVGNVVKHRSKAKTPFFVPTLSGEDSLAKVSKLMIGAATNVLPVLDGKKKVIGVVHARDILLATASEYKGITCDKLGSMKPITCGPEDPVNKAVTALNKYGIDHLPVVSKDGTLLGMIGMSDLLANEQIWNSDAQKISQAASHQGGKRSGYNSGEKNSLLSLPVKNFMSKKTMCCTKADTTIPNAIEQMCDAGVCSIVLVKNNKPVGILTAGDVLKDYAKS